VCCSVAGPAAAVGGAAAGALLGHFLPPCWSLVMRDVIPAQIKATKAQACVCGVDTTPGSRSAAGTFGIKHDTALI
jgi:hypothetical protein